MRIKATLIQAVLFAALCMGRAGAVDVFVAPDGRDTHSGSQERPFTTVQAAQNAVRGFIAEGLTEPVNVIFRAGTYPLNAPLFLEPRDSGTAACPITWRAAEGERVVLSAGREIIGTWTRGDDGLWYVDVSSLVADWNFRQVFVQGRRATRARFPNVDTPNPFLYATGGGVDHAVIDPTLVKAGWGTASDAQINIVSVSRISGFDIPRSRWGRSRRACTPIPP
jgi:hypothetical protein